MTELKELEKWKAKSSFWQISITLARPIFRPFATHTLGTAAIVYDIQKTNERKIIFASGKSIPNFWTGFRAVLSTDLHNTVIEDKKAKMLKALKTWFILLTVTIFPAREFYLENVSNLRSYRIYSSISRIFCTKNSPKSQVRLI